MLRHACGFALANKGHDTQALQANLDHKNIPHTVRYTALAAGRFKDFRRQAWTPASLGVLRPVDRFSAMSLRLRLRDWRSLRNAL